MGFRPFVWRLACALDISGTVCNDAEGVLIDAYGEDLDCFEQRLVAEAPEIADITSLESVAISWSEREEFEIIASRSGIAQTRVTPDLALCEDCDAEIGDSSQKRYQYAFTNCTNCGPRFSIVKALPYDRAHTVMKDFTLCDYCAGQYQNPADRRFHAQPVACPDCGPQIAYHGQQGMAAIKAAAQDLRQGMILAIKGIGGFHLAVDARNETAITTLRHRKYRPTKPFALMASEEMVAQYAGLDDHSRDMLRGKAAPITLLERKGELPAALAPEQDRLGWMLPYTPLHQLLIQQFDGILVMTSANLSGEPQIIDNQEALEKLSGVADRFLLHDRDIARRLDDSLVQFFNGEALILRRARGYTPATIALPPGFEKAPAVTGFGGLLKSTITMIQNGEALVSHHLGDLDNWSVYEAYEKAHQDYAALFDHQATLGAVDLHPDFASRRFAEELRIPMVEVQHHHAHMAAVMGEHLIPLDHPPVLGIILDGLGLGSDGTIWGGEILLGDYCGFERVGWLRPSPLIGGDLAQKQPYRNALARLDDAGLSELANMLFAHQPLDILRQARMSGLNVAQSSSAGRLFDAFAALLGKSADAQSYEGEAAMALEALAKKADLVAPYEFSIVGKEIDPSPIFRNWAARRHEESSAIQAARFHQSIASAFAKYARDVAQENNIDTIILSGGCVQNRLLLAQLLKGLQGFNILYPQQFPANDGGLSLGQALIAAAQTLLGGK